MCFFCILITFLISLFLLLLLLLFMLKGGSKTSRRSTHCQCTHLTSFAAAFDVAPNHIDFQAVWAGFGSMFDSGNVSVLFTIVSLFLIYAVFAVWCRRADNRDNTQVMEIVLNQHSNYTYIGTDTFIKYHYHLIAKV